MLIGAGLITLFAIVFFGGSQNDLFFIDFDKEAKNIIVEKSRYEEVKTLNKGLVAIEKEYAKQGKQLGKDFKSLLANQETTQEEFVNFLDVIMNNEEEADRKYFALRDKIQQQFMEDEWEKMIANVDQKMAKSEKKTQKALTKYNANLDGLSESIVRATTDEKSKTEADKIMSEFTLNANKLASEMSLYSEREMMILKQHQPKREDLSGVITAYNDEMKQFYQLVFKLHKDLARITPESQWKKVAKQLEKISQASF